MNIKNKELTLEHMKDMTDTFISNYEDDGFSMSMKCKTLFMLERFCNYINWLDFRKTLKDIEDIEEVNNLYPDYMQLVLDHNDIEV